MKWYYNSHTGSVMYLPVHLGYMYLKSGTGWHGPFDTKARALAFFEEGKAANPGWKAPTGWKENIANALPSVQNTLEEKLGALNLTNWFLRIGEIILGVVLIGVGVAKLTGTTNVISSALRVKL